MLCSSFEFDNLLWFQNHRTFIYVCKKKLILKSKESSVFDFKSWNLAKLYKKKKHLRKGEENKQGSCHVNNTWMKFFCLHTCWWRHLKTSTSVRNKLSWNSWKGADSFHERIAEELEWRQFRLQSFDPFFDFLEPSSRVKSQNPFYDFWSTHQSRVRTGCFIIWEPLVKGSMHYSICLT